MRNLKIFNLKDEWWGAAPRLDPVGRLGGGKSNMYYLTFQTIVHVLTFRPSPDIFNSDHQLQTIRIISWIVFQFLFSTKSIFLFPIHCSILQFENIVFLIHRRSVTRRKSLWRRTALWRGRTKLGSTIARGMYFERDDGGGAQWTNLGLLFFCWSTEIVSISSIFMRWQQKDA